MSFKVELARAIYPANCVDEARAAFAEHCSVAVFPGPSGSCTIEICSLSNPAEEKRAAGEFLNHLLNLSIEYHLSRS